VPPVTLARAFHAPHASRDNVSVQIAADHGLGLLPLSNLHRFHMAFLTQPGVETDEIDEVCAVQQQLPHDRIVVIAR
jgi:hypothetical protein